MGTYNCVFSKKSMCIYKCHEFMEGFMLRLRAWRQVEKNFPEMMTDLRMNILKDYEYTIRKPIQIYK